MATRIRDYEEVRLELLSRQRLNGMLDFPNNSVKGTTTGRVPRAAVDGLMPLVVASFSGAAFGLSNLSGCGFR